MTDVFHEEVEEKGIKKDGKMEEKGEMEEGKKVEKKEEPKAKRRKQASRNAKPKFALI